MPAALSNTIGTAEFFDLVGTVYPRQPQIELIERPGVDDVGARFNGTRGKPFRLLSVTYFASFDYAYAEFSSYIALKQTLQVLTRNSTTIGNVLVIEVAEAKPPQAVYNVAGAPGAQCRAEVLWTLIAMP